MALSLLFKGFNYVDYYNGEYHDNHSLPQVAATGANGVALTPDWGIDVADSTIYAGGATTDSLADLTTAIDEATANGMTAFVRPSIDFLYVQQSPTDANGYYVPQLYQSPGNPGTNPDNVPNGVTPATVPTNAQNPNAYTVSYRGFLNPADLNLAKFFGSPTQVGSYDDMIVSEAKQAQSAGAKLFSVGTELDLLADDTSPAVVKDWDNLIADVRTVFHGALTYSANWATAEQVTFWDKLDYVGLDGYVPLSNTVPDAQNDDNPSLASLVAGWNTTSNVQIAYSGGATVGQQLGNQSAIDAFDEMAQKSIDKQFIFTEIGYQNDTGAATDPTGGSNQGTPDPSLQAELYQAFFNAWGGAEQTAAANGGVLDGTPYSMAGAYFWDWNPDTSASGYDDWSVSGYPAADTITSGFMSNGPLAYAESNIAGTAGPEGEPRMARGSAGTNGTGALAGDSDSGDAALTITAVAGGTVGTFFDTQYGSLQLNADGSYVYSVDATALNAAPDGAPPVDVIPYTVTDANGATAISRLIITDYRNPDAVAETATIQAGHAISGTAGIGGTGLIAGDSDPDGDTASIHAEVVDDLSDVEPSPVTGQYGTLTYNSDGAYTYTAKSGSALASAFAADDGQPLTDIFQLIVSGGEASGFAQSSLTVSIDEVPALAFTTASIGANVTLTGLAVAPAGVQQVRIFNGSTSLGVATLNGTDWSLTTTALSSHNFSGVVGHLTDDNNAVTTFSLGGLSSVSFTAAGETATFSGPQIAASAKIDGGNHGTDTLIVQGTSVNLSDVTFQNWTSSDNVEIDGSATAASSLTAGSVATTLKGGSGVDALKGGSGNDLLDGGVGADQMHGGAGNDTYVVSDAGDKAFEANGQGTDLVEASVSYSISGQYVENLTLTGTGNIAATGNTLANTITGNAGNNRIDGGTGADQMHGGAGNDTYIVDNAGDKAFEANGQGTDLVDSSVTYALTGQYIENLTLNGTGNINATGNSLANTLTGNAGNNILDGSTGADTMTGGLGDDAYYVDNVGDKVVEANGAGTDVVRTTVSFSLAGQYVENMRLTGSAAIDGTGNSLANLIIGNDAANTLDGSTGDDTLTGGAGADTFKFSTALNASTNLDTITDFTHGTDKIELSHAIFTALATTSGTLSQADFTSHIAYNSGTGALSYDSNGAAAGGQTQFATLAAHLTLTNTDFAVV